MDRSLESRKNWIRRDAGKRPGCNSSNEKCAIRWRTLSNSKFRPNDSSDLRGTKRKVVEHLENDFCIIRAMNISKNHIFFVSAVNVGAKSKDCVGHAQLVVDVSNESLVYRVGDLSVRRFDAGITAPIRVAQK